MLLETNRKKTTIWVSALTFGIVAVIFTGFYLSRLDSVNKMQEAANNPSGIIVYDTLCYGGFTGSIPYTLGTGRRELTETAQWTDVEAATSLISDLR